MALKRISEDIGLQWAESEPGRLQKVKNYFWRVVHISLAGKTPTLGATVWFLMRLALILTIASAPQWPRWIESEKEKQAYAWYYFGGIVTLLALKWIFDKLNEKFKFASAVKKHKEGSALEQRNLFNEMISFTNVPEPDFNSASFINVINRALNAIHDKVREEIGALDATFLQVSLMVFSQDDQIEVVARAGSRRQIRRAISRQCTMAYFVAKARLPWKRVPDLRADKVFAHEGISQADCPYRSVLLIPVTFDVDSKACGVITIDSSRAYEFWNYDSSQNIFMQVMPFVRLVAILLQEHKERV